MQSLRNFIKRNAPVFFLGLIILVVFVAIILSNPSVNNNVPAGFRRVEEEVFNGGEPAEPTPEEKPTEYAPQVASPENKGKPYFRGENNPNLRDNEGYPTTPPLGSTVIPAEYSDEDRGVLEGMEMEKIAERSKPTRIAFTKNGFSPTDASGYTGREIIWTNTTDKEIKIIEPVSKHEALKGGVTIKPGGSFSFKPLVDKMLTYMEVNSKEYGTILVRDITEPLLPGYKPGM